MICDEKPRRSEKIDRKKGRKEERREEY